MKKETLTYDCGSNCNQEHKLTLDEGTMYSLYLTYLHKIMKKEHLDGMWEEFKEFTKERQKTWSAEHVSSVDMSYEMISEYFENQNKQLK